MKQKPSYLPKKYKYSARTGNLKAEAVGVVKGEKHFPVFKGNLVFKPLTKSKPLSTPLFAYAEVFWSWLIDAYFLPAPQTGCPFLHCRPFLCFLQTDRPSGYPFLLQRHPSDLLLPSSAH